MNDMNGQEKKYSQQETDEIFNKLADIFIAQANIECKTEDHQLVNASLLYASARFSAFISSATSTTKEDFQKNSIEDTEFYTQEFNKMLKENMKQYESVFDKK